MVWRRFCYAPSECGEGWWHEKGNEEADWRMLLKELWWLIGYEYWHFMQIQIIVQVTTLTKIVLWEKFWNNPKPFSTVTNSQLSQYRFPLLTKWIHSHKMQFCSKGTLIFLLICIMNLKTCCYGNKKSPNGYRVVPLTRRSWAGPGLYALTRVTSCGQVCCSSGCSSPFLIAVSSFLTPQCLLRHDGAWPNASQEMS